MDHGERGHVDEMVRILESGMTALPAINAIPAVVAAPPGIVTYTDLFRAHPNGWVA